MASFVISRLAEADIMEIGYYTERTWGTQQSNVYLKDIYKCFKFVSNNPKIGVSCYEIRHGYHKYRYKKHIIFYRIAKDLNIEIIRILHENMDTIKYL